MSQPDRSSVKLAERLGVNAYVGSVVSSKQISTSLYEVILKGNAEKLAGVPGNDVMVRMTDNNGAFGRRRYSVRSVDAENDQFTLWVSTDHEGPGSHWAKNAKPGDEVDLVGPRGKIPLDPLADWYLFMGDVSGLAAFYRMAESIEIPGKAIFIVETKHDDDAVTASLDEGLGVTGIFVDKNGRAENDPAGLLSGLSAFAFPPDEGHAYLFGEFTITKVLREALLDRGLKDEQISRKAFWRHGEKNAENGEPSKQD